MAIYIASSYLISIHLMLWFNFIRNLVYDNPHIISIHLMLWFNYKVHFLPYTTNAFQYILCCGSTSTKTIIKNIPKNISIHLMLWFNHNFHGNALYQYHFNTSYVVVQQLSDDLNNWFDNHFNTSYVVVQLD